MKLVYVCSPYGGLMDNIKKAWKYCRYVVEKGHVPIAPQVIFPFFMSEENERELIMKMNKKILEVCDELWIFGNKITEGMYEEIKYFTSIKGDKGVVKIIQNL